MTPDAPTADLDQRTRAYGEEIFARLDRRGPTVFTPAWLDDQLMQWSMGDGAVKVQLFRFIDALPNLKTPEEVSRHLKEYFAEAVSRRLRPILRLARRHGAFVNFDMEQYSSKDITLRIFQEVLTEDEFRDWRDVGIAIQAYLRDTEDDLKALLRWAERRGTQVWV